MTGAELAEKRLCTRCKNLLPLSSFYPNSKGRNGVTSKCRECHLDDWRLRKYGVTTEDYEELLALQGDVCAICQCRETIARGEKVHKLAVDHDHATGLVRGLLCQRCNTGLGKFRDSPTILTLALMYLHSHTTTTRHKRHGCHFRAEGSLMIDRSSN